MTNTQCFCCGAGHGIEGVLDGRVTQHSTYCAMVAAVWRERSQLEKKLAGTFVLRWNVAYSSHGSLRQIYVQNVRIPLLNNGPGRRSSYAFHRSEFFARVKKKKGQLERFMAHLIAA